MTLGSAPVMKSMERSWKAIRGEQRVLAAALFLVVPCGRSLRHLPIVSPWHMNVLGEVTR
jgi:hypothetical protein